LWDRDKDKFKLGQWLKGRIYERRSDISADGKHFIYFAMNGKWQSESKGSWTAISRAPYLKAITIFPQGDCWLGGGLFTERDKQGKNLYWLNSGGCEPLRTTSEVLEDSHFVISKRFNSECLGVYYPRLQRDGWTLTERQPTADLFEKPIGQGWLLRKIAHSQSKHPPGKGCYWDEHQLVHPNRGKQVNYPDWEWAELDNDRIVWAEGGCLFASKIDRDGLTGKKRLFDFNDMVFEPIEAPY